MLASNVRESFLNLENYPETPPNGAYKHLMLPRFNSAIKLSSYCDHRSFSGWSAVIHKTSFTNQRLCYTMILSHCTRKASYVKLKNILVKCTCNNCHNLLLAMTVFYFDLLSYPVLSYRRDLDHLKFSELIARRKRKLAFQKKKKKAYEKTRIRKMHQPDLLVIQPPNKVNKIVTRYLIHKRHINRPHHGVAIITFNLCKSQVHLWFRFNGSRVEQ